ncbi:MAG: tetratricopeptide repeat protein [Sumerlaeia bacterium]
MTRRDPCIAILPFALADQGEGKSWQDGFGEVAADDFVLSMGLAAFLETRLRPIPKSQVFVQHIILTLDGDTKAGPNDAPLSRTSAWPLEEALGLPHPPGLEPTHLVQGSMSWGEKPRLTLEVIDREAGTTLYQRDMEASPEVFLSAFFTQLGKMVESISEDLEPIRRWAIAQSPTRSPDAFAEHLRGLGHLARIRAAQTDPLAPPANVRYRFGHFLESLRHDPEFREPCSVLDMLAKESLGAGLEAKREAAHALREARVLAPQHTGFGGLLGCLLFDLDLPKEARPLLERYLAGTHGLARREAMVRLARIDFDGGRFARAERTLALAAQAHPEDLEVLEWLGQCREALGDDDRAERCWRAILDQHPRHSTALYRLGLQYRRKGEIRKAQIVLERAIEGPEVDPRAYPTLVEFLLERKQQLERADEVATLWVEESAENWRAWLALAEVRCARGQANVAQHCLQKAAALQDGEDTEGEIRRVAFAVHSPSDDKVYRRVLSVLEQSGKPGEEPVKTLRYLTDRHPGEPFLWSSLAGLLERMGRLESALLARRREVELLPRSARAMHLLGHLQSRAELDWEAEGSLRQAVAIAPERSECLKELVRVLIKQGKNASAMTELRKLQHQLIEDPDIEEFLEILDARDSMPKKMSAVGAEPVGGMLTRLGTWFGLFRHR